jgi:peptidylprolyl isomerase
MLRLKEIILEKAENGNYISVEYTGKLKDGQVFDTSEGRQPMEVHIGAGQMIPGFEAQLMGMALNEKKVFTLSPEEAYGQRNDDLMQSVPRSEVPPDMDVTVGMVVGLMTQDGKRIPARIVQLDEEELTMDLNHPLAGESLTFEIEVVGISDTPTQEPSGCSAGCDCDCSGECEE